MLEDTRATLYQDIGKLAPAHSITVTSTAFRERRYWSLNPDARITMSDDEYAEAFREHFTEAVASTMRASGRVGSMLSGGLDSSSIVAVARTIRKGARSLPTFSAVYEVSPECDERDFIDAVLAGGGVEPHYVQPEKLSLFQAWEDGSDFEDEPIWDPQIAVLWALGRAARQADVAVLLSGFGGDSVVSYGFGYLTELASQGRWVRALSEAAQVSRHLQRPLTSVIRTMLLRPLAPRPARLMWRRVRRQQPEWSWRMPLRGAFAARIGLADRYAAFTGPPGTVTRTAREEHFEELSSGLLTFYLAQNDRVAASRGIEQRYPFLDRRLVEFCLALPGAQKLGGGLNRIIMRRALADVLPPKVRLRGWKANLAPSVDQRLMTLDRPLVERMIAEPGSLGEYVDAQALDDIYRRFRSHGSSEDAYTVWRAVSLGLWLERTQRGAETPAHAVPAPMAAR
jgi:asparagine synthase (glutamine-hydrolysing)